MQVAGWLAALICALAAGLCALEGVVGPTEALSVCGRLVVAVCMRLAGWLMWAQCRAARTDRCCRYSCASVCMWLDLRLSVCDSVAGRALIVTQQAGAATDNGITVCLLLLLLPGVPAVPGCCCAADAALLDAPDQVRRLPSAALAEHCVHLNAFPGAHCCSTTIAFFGRAGNASAAVRSAMRFATFLAHRPQMHPERFANTAACCDVPDTRHHHR